MIPYKERKEHAIRTNYMARIKFEKIILNDNIF